MADVIGPNSYLPGRILRSEHMIKGHTCDQCSGAEPPVEKPAVAAMIAETDSHGSEVHHYCEDCIKAIEEEQEKNNSEDELKYCDHCEAQSKDVRPMRDPEEGSCGRLYYLCEQHRSVLLSSFVDDDDCSPQHYGYDD